MFLGLADLTGAGPIDAGRTPAQRMAPNPSSILKGTA